MYGLAGNWNTISKTDHNYVGNKKNNQLIDCGNTMHVHINVHIFIVNDIKAM